MGWIEITWIVLWTVAITVQLIGMRTGMPKSRIIGRLQRHALWISMLVGAFVWWLPFHWFFGTATGVSWWDATGVGIGLLFGYYAHRRTLDATE